MSHLNLVGAAGEYYVCAELCRRGILAVLTPKNNPMFDVIASAPDGMKNTTLQVKTRSVENKQGWKIGVDIENPDKSKGKYIILVNLHEQQLPDFYIYTCKELADRVSAVYKKYIETPKRDGTPKKPVAFRWFDEVSFTSDDWSRKNNWSLICTELGLDPQLKSQTP